MLLLEGKTVAQALRGQVKSEIEELIHKADRPPCLAVILVGDDPASHIYVGNKEKACEKAGMRSVSHLLPESTPQAKLIELILNLNRNDAIDGILLQLPLPKGLDAAEAIQSIDPEKDVDGLHPINQGRLTLGLPGLRPCTPAGTMALLEYYNIPTDGKKAVVLGRSNLVGRPLSIMLSSRPANATVTLCHSATPNLEEFTLQADLIFAAIGCPSYLKPSMIKEGAVVIDVGINRVSHGLCGDTDFEGLKGKVSAITPVPGGIGLMTITQLLRNTLITWKKRFSID